MSVSNFSSSLFAFSSLSHFSLLSRELCEDRLGSSARKDFSFSRAHALRFLLFPSLRLPSSLFFEYFFPSFHRTTRRNSRTTRRNSKHEGGAEFGVFASPSPRPCVWVGGKEKGNERERTSKSVRERETKRKGLKERERRRQ